MFNKIEYDNKNDDNYISNELIRLDFDSQGLLYKFHDLTTGETYSLTQELLYYRGRRMDKGANWGDQPSGAYILNPVQEMKINNKIDLKNIKVSKINHRAKQCKEMLNLNNVKNKVFIMTELFT
uniref:Uncharacterized protein n=1 Tax=Acrobeloides nanus TaxID=290746 RepID=A0A914EAV2_9BILA